MSHNLKKRAQKVQASLVELGLNLKVVEVSDSTRTAQESAGANGCTVGQIVKSLILQGKTSQKPILVIASATNRANEKTVREVTWEKLKKANTDFVLEHTGFAIGGI